MVSRASPAILVSTSNATEAQLNNRPGGVVAYKAVTQNGGLINSSEATLTDFDTGPIVTDTDRLYRITFQLALQMNGPADAVVQPRIWLTYGDDTHLCFVDSVGFFGDPNVNECLGRTYLDIPGANSALRYKLRGEVIFAAYGSTVGLPFPACDTSLPGWIMVEDVGPSTGYS